MGSPSLYHKIGGSAGLARATALFYQKVISDPDLNPFFEGVNLKRQRKMMASFLSSALGGPSSYSGSTLREAHRHLVKRGLHEGHFVAVVAHLQQTLSELGVDDETIRTIGTSISALGPQVLGRAAAADVE